MAKSIPRRWVDNYSDVLDALSAKAQREVREAVAKVDLTDIAVARDAIIAIMEPLCAAYTDSAAAVSARFYEICRNYCLGGEYEAYVASQRVPGATEGAVRALIQIIVDGKPAAEFYDALAERIDYEIKRAAGECTYYNGENDSYRGEN